MSRCRTPRSTAYKCESSLSQGKVEDAESQDSTLGGRIWGMEVVSFESHLSRRSLKEIEESFRELIPKNPDSTRNPKP